MGDITVKKEMNITYETIFDLLIREKNREEIQKLDNTYFADIVAYLEQKLASRNGKTYEELKILENQIDNAKRLIKELYDRREKKIILMALNKSRIKNYETKTEFLLPQEKELLKSISSQLKEHRDEILGSVLKAVKPNAALYSSSASNSEQIHEPEFSNGHNAAVESSTAESDVQEPEAQGESINELQEPTPQQSTQQSVEPKIAPNPQNLPQKTIKCTQEIPQFVDDNLQIIGPYEVGDIVKMPLSIAEILVSKGKAEHYS